MGVASAAADLTDATVDSVLSKYIDESYHKDFEENVRDGGMSCWVRTVDGEAVTRATQVLAAAGGEHIYETEV